MDPLVILIGLFILAAVISNKELSGEDATEEGKDIFTYFIVFVIVMVLGGLCIFFKNRYELPAQYSFLVGSYILLVVFPTYAKGNARVMARIAGIAVFVYVIMGSYW